MNLITVHDGFTLRDLVSYDDKHNEANGEDNRDGTERQPVLELRRRGPDRRPGHPRPARPAVPGHAHHAAAVLRRAAAARRRRDRPHPAGQQQRLLPGQRDHLVRLVARRTPGCWTFTTAAHRAAQGAPGVPPPPFPGRGRRRRPALVHPGRQPDEPAPTGPTRTPWPSRCTWTAPTPPTGPRTAPGCSTTTSWCWSTPGGSRSTSSCRTPGRGGRWQAEIDTYDPAPRPDAPVRQTPAIMSPSDPGPSSCCAPTHHAEHSQATCLA